jgi:hypothetical protein
VDACNVSRAMRPRVAGIRTRRANSGTRTRRASPLPQGFATRLMTKSSLYLPPLDRNASVLSWICRPGPPTRIRVPNGAAPMFRNSQGEKLHDVLLLHVIFYHVIFYHVIFYHVSPSSSP